MRMRMRETVCSSTDPNTPNNSQIKYTTYCCLKSQMCQMCFVLNKKNLFWAEIWTSAWMLGSTSTRGQVRVQSLCRQQTEESKTSNVAIMIALGKRPSLQRLLRVSEDLPM